VPTSVGADIATPLSASIEMPTKARNARALLKTEEFMLFMLTLLRLELPRLTEQRRSAT
jgi:hypothetical protein